MGKRSKDIFLQLVRAAGYCCPYTFFVANSKLRTGLIASILGLEPRTIRLHRAAFRAQTLVPCAHCHTEKGKKLQQMALTSGGLHDTSNT
jgi:hypothetical protein